VVFEFFLLAFDRVDVLAVLLRNGHAVSSRKSIEQFCVLVVCHGSDGGLVDCLV
jgi:hypothetical protein